MSAQPSHAPPQAREVSADLMDSLVQTSFTVIAILSQAAAAHEMSLTQLRVLAILRDREPKMAELAAHLGLDRSSVSGLIDRVVRRGLAQRIASQDDGRSVRVSLTDDGRAVVGPLTVELADMLAPMTCGLSAPEQKRLGILLMRMLARSDTGPSAH